MKKYSKVFGEVEVTNDNGTVSTIVIVKTGETKKVLNANANLSDTPFAVEAKKTTSKAKELSSEDNAHLAFINRNGSALLNSIIESKNNCKNTRYCFSYC